MLTPEEVESKVFNKALRGYSTDEVDVFLDEIATTYKALNAKIAELEKNQGAKAAAPDPAVEAELQRKFQELEKARAEMDEARVRIIEEAKTAAKEIIEAAITKAKEIVAGE